MTRTGGGRRGTGAHDVGWDGNNGLRMADPLSTVAELLVPAFEKVVGRTDVDPVVRPSDRADAQVNGALPLAKQVGTNPRELAQAVVDTGVLDGVCSAVEIAGPGFVNLTFRAPGFENALYVAAASFGTRPGIALPWGTLPLNWDPLFQLSLVVPTAFVNFQGIVGPLGDVRPSWRWLVVAGLIAGAPTFIGAIVGYQVTSEPLELAFYGVAGGAILYVVGEIWQGMRRFGHRELGLAMLALGFAAGVVTDLVVVYGGG